MLTLPALIALPMSVTTQSGDPVAASVTRVATVVLSVTGLLASLFLVALIMLTLLLALARSGYRPEREPLPWRRIGGAESPQSNKRTLAAQKRPSKGADLE